MPKLILCDLPSKGRCACWSLNPWKTRLALNFKGIEYDTEWVEYPDVEPKLISLYSLQVRLSVLANLNSVTANDPSHNPIPYSIPAVQFSPGDYVMDSKAIAIRLEREYPSPSMHLDAEVLGKVEKLVAKQQEALRGVWMPDIPLSLLNPSSAEYFERTRSQRFGKPLAQLKKETGGEEAWIEALPTLKELADVILGNGGPFCLGDTPSYADFVIVSWLHFLERIDHNHYQKVAQVNKAYETLYIASKKWLKRDDH